MILVVPDLSYLWIAVSITLYLAQIGEVLMSETFKLLSSTQTSWDDLDVFRHWFYELKKCRPILTFTFTPTKKQSMILCELHIFEKTLSNSYREL